MSSKIAKIILRLFIFISFLFATFHPIPAYSADSRPSNWALAAVEWFKDNGYADSSFFSDYQKPLTRQEAAMLFVKAYDFFAPGSSAVQTGEDAYSFADKYTTEYRDYIEKAYELGIIKGYGDNTFGALDPVTREQMSVMIVRFLDKLAPGEFDYGKYSSYISNFADDEDISVWAKGPLLYLNHMGIIRGVSGNRIDPKGHVTREQAMVIVNRLMTSGSILSVLQSNVDSKDVYSISSYDDLKRPLCQLS